MQGLESILEMMKDQQERHRMLILSLGTGNLYQKKDLSAQEAWESDSEIVYRSANYMISGEQEMITSEFVAEPLIRRIKPDTILVIGTVRSAWSELYRVYSRKEGCDRSAFEAMFAKENAYGIRTGREEIDRFQEEINGYYREAKLFQQICPGVAVRVILTHYGINEEELKENYARISQIRSYLKEDAKNLVSFDITHSFRSMPLYNLIILNYINNLTACDVEIEHIYYGNLEISSEYIVSGKPVAVISDLGDLSEVLKLTNAVAEFKHTGNAGAVIALLPQETEQQQKIRESMLAFDWATQMNDLKSMEVSLRRLMKAIEKEKSAEKKNAEKIKDIYVMMDQVLSERFPSVEQFGRMNRLKEDPAVYGIIQTKLGKWFLETNRYGQAMLIATEALRSYVVGLSLAKNNKELSREKYENEEERANSELLYRQLKGSRNLSDSSRKLFTNIHPMKKMRNIYAHNLSESGQGGDKTEDRRDAANSVKKMIEEFYNGLELFGEELQDHWKEILGEIR